MRKRTKRKLQQTVKLSHFLNDLSEDISNSANQLQTNMIRLNWLVKENTSIVSRFPQKVEDFITHPPIHNGTYLVYFVRETGVHLRMYRFVGGKWFDGKGREIDILRLKPSCYLYAPVLTPEAIEFYRGRLK